MTRSPGGHRTGSEDQTRRWATRDGREFDDANLPASAGVCISNGAPMDLRPQKFWGLWRHNPIVKRLAVLLFVVGGLALGACTTPFSSSSPTTTTQPAITAATLCGSIPRINELVVTRHSGIAGSHFTFARVVRVYDAAAAQRVASAMCALPTLSRTVFCPAEMAFSYELKFGYSVPPPPGHEVHNAEVYMTVTMGPTGCQTITGLPSTRWFVGHQDFYRVLGVAMGLHAANRSTFVGYPPMTLHP